MGKHKEEEKWDPLMYDKNARFVSDLGVPVVELLDPQPNERILDIGCGDGKLTFKIYDMGVDVIGVDSSEAMIAATKALGLRAFHIDAQDPLFRHKISDAISNGQGCTTSTPSVVFDAVFSNAALHWMKQPDVVIQNVAEVLKDGGRFVAEMGGFGNVQSVRSALAEAFISRELDWSGTDPWFFPTAEEYQELLEQAGFEVSFIKLIPRPTLLPTDVGGWLDTFGAAFFGSITSENLLQIKQEIVTKLEPVLCKEGRWHMDYVRLRFCAFKKKGK